MNATAVSHLPVSRSPLAKSPKPPGHLSAASKRWFRSVVSEFVMSDTDLRVLTKAAEQFDISEETRRVLRTEGRWYTDPKGIMRAHPAVKIEKDSTTLAARLVRDLQLDMPPPRAPGRPPGPGPTPKRS
jgi:P27 family predicted phage terminase small subunit